MKKNILFSIISLLIFVLLLSGCTKIVHLSAGTFVTPYNYSNEYIDSASLTVERVNSKNGQILNESPGRLYHIQLMIYKNEKEYEITFSNIKFLGNNYEAKYNALYSLIFDNNTYEGFCSIAAYPINNPNGYELNNKIKYMFVFDGNLKEIIPSLELNDYDTHKIVSSKYVSNKIIIDDENCNFYIENTNNIVEQKSTYLFNLSFIQSSEIFILFNKNSEPKINFNIIEVEPLTADGNQLKLKIKTIYKGTEYDVEANLIIEKKGFININFKNLPIDLPNDYRLFDANVNKLDYGVYSNQMINEYDLKTIVLTIDKASINEFVFYNPSDNSFINFDINAISSTNIPFKIDICEFKYSLGTNYIKCYGKCMFVYNNDESIESEHYFELYFIDNDTVKLCLGDYLSNMNVMNPKNLTQIELKRGE